MTASGWHRKVRTQADTQRQREYNSREYKAQHAAAARLVASGQAICWRPQCQRWIPPGSPWHLGHDDYDRRIIRGPEHASCNLGAAASKGARMVNARRHAVRRRVLPRW